MTKRTDLQALVLRLLRKVFINRTHNCAKQMLPNVALSEGKANPCWRAPPDRGREFQDVLSVKEPLIVMYRIRPCHRMIPLSVKIRTHAVSSCGPGAALSTLSPRFRHLRSCTKCCDYLPVRWGHVISLSYKPSISSQTRAGRTRVTFPGVSVSATDRWSYGTHTADRKSTT